MLTIFGVVDFLNVLINTFCEISVDADRAPPVGAHLLALSQVYLGSPIFLFKVDGCVLHTQHVNLKIIGDTRGRDT